MRTDFGGGSRESKLLALAARHTARRLINAWSLVPGAPWPYGLMDHVGRLQRKVRGTTFEPAQLPHCRAELIRAPESTATRHILYLHGGAFLVGGRHLHRALISRIASVTGSTVLSVQYRKLPKHPLAASTEDAVDAYRFLLDKGVRPEHIVIMGDSAGGFLAFTATEAARLAGLPPPAAIVALAPLVDFDLDRTPMQSNAGCDFFSPRSLTSFAAIGHRTSPEGLRSPMDVDTALLPPVLLQVSSAESLYSQVVALADRLTQAGVPTELQVWDGQVHVFQSFQALPEARQALDCIAEFVMDATPLLRVVRSA